MCVKKIHPKLCTTYYRGTNAVGGETPLASPGWEGEGAGHFLKKYVNGLY